MENIINTIEDKYLTETVEMLAPQEITLAKDDKKMVFEIVNCFPRKVLSGKGDLALDKDGKEMAAYGSGDTPWHNAGVTVEGLMTSEEALKLARLDYEVVKHPSSTVIVRDGKMLNIINPNMFNAVRMDTLEVIGSGLGNRYSVIQNTEAFRILDRFFGEGAMLIDSCGAIDNGARVWMLCKVPSKFFINASDMVNNYILFANTHDGSGALSAQITPMRVECRNMFLAAMGQATNRVSIRHTPNWMNGEPRIREVLGLADHYEEVLFNLMEDSRMNKLDVDGFNKVYLDRIVPVVGLEGIKLTKATGLRDRLVERYRNGKGNEGLTHWDAINAFTEESTWGGSFKETSRTSRESNAFKGRMMEDHDLTSKAVNTYLASVAIGEKLASVL